MLLGHVAVFAVLLAAPAARAAWSSLRMRESGEAVLGAVALPLAGSLYVATTTSRRRPERPLATLPTGNDFHMLLTGV